MCAPCRPEWHLEVSSFVEAPELPSQRPKSRLPPVRQSRSGGGFQGACALWCAVHVAVMVAGSSALRLLRVDGLPVLSYTIPVVLCTTLLFAAKFLPARSLSIVCAVCVGMSVWVGWALRRLISQIVDDTLEMSLSDLQTKLPADPPALAFLRAYIHKEVTMAAVALYFIYNFLHVDLLHLSDCPQGLTFLILSVPVAFVHAALLLPVVPGHLYATAVAGAMLGAYYVMITIRF